jgi:hypothetical protein
VQDNNQTPVQGKSGDESPHSKSALLIVAAFSRRPDAFAWARGRLEAEHGPVTREGDEFIFDQTTYYERTMGPGLRKRLWAFGVIDAARLADVKRATIALEAEYAAQAGHHEPRPLNLDPGYLDLGKFVLASTKDHSHRIYLRDGIFAEVTLYFQHGAFRPWPWTYADYRLESVHAFLSAARADFRRMTS